LNEEKANGKESVRNAPSGFANTRVYKEIDDIKGAADFLGCSPRTLEGWIIKGTFTAEDGLRRFGALLRFHMPTLKERVKRDTLMKNSERQPGARSSHDNTARCSAGSGERAATDRNDACFS
jgi:hypothetical protein